MNAETGNYLWAMLDKFSADYPDSPSKEQQIDAKIWLEGWTLMLESSSRGCDCAEFWRRIMLSAYPPFESQDRIREWVMVVHDCVNEKLGKPHFWENTKDHATYKKLTPLFQPLKFGKTVAQQPKCGSCGGR